MVPGSTSTRDPFFQRVSDMIDEARSSLSSGTMSMNLRRWAYARRAWASMAPIVALSHRRNGYYVAVMEGGDGPLLNGRAIGPEPTLLNEGDELELAGTRMRFKLKA